MLCALSTSRIIGPFFLNKATLNSKFYTALFQGFLIPELRQLNLFKTALFFQQDVAPYHYASNVWRLLHYVFTEQCIGTAGPIAWPSSSSLLTPLDYLSWGHVKTVLYSPISRSLDQIKVRITNAVHEISNRQLDNVCEELEYVLRMCPKRR